MSEPLKSIHVRLSPEFYERLETMAACQQSDVAKHARSMLEKTIAGEWYLFEKKMTKLTEAVQGLESGTPLPPKSAAGFIYVIRINDLFKIGKSIRPEKRINSMTLPQAPEMICVIKASDRQATESELHRLYKQYRHHGEWFKLPAEAVAELRGRASV